MAADDPMLEFLMAADPVENLKRAALGLKLIPSLEQQEFDQWQDMLQHKDIHGGLNVRDGDGRGRL